MRRVNNDTINTTIGATVTMDDGEVVSAATVLDGAGVPLLPVAGVLVAGAPLLGGALVDGASVGDGALVGLVGGSVALDDDMQPMRFFATTNESTNKCMSSGIVAVPP